MRDGRKMRGRFKRRLREVVVPYYSIITPAYTSALHAEGSGLEPQRKHILLGDSLLQQICCSRNNVPNVGKFKLLLMIIISQGGIVMLVLH